MWAFIVAEWGTSIGPVIGELSDVGHLGVGVVEFLLFRPKAIVRIAAASNGDHHDGIVRCGENHAGEKALEPETRVVVQHV